MGVMGEELLGSLTTVCDNDMRLRPRGNQHNGCKNMHSRCQDWTCGKVVCPGLVVTSASVRETHTQCPPRPPPPRWAMATLRLCVCMPLAKHTPRLCQWPSDLTPLGASAPCWTEIEDKMGGERFTIQKDKTSSNTTRLLDGAGVKGEGGRKVLNSC